MYCIFIIRHKNYLEVPAQLHAALLSAVGWIYFNKSKWKYLEQIYLTFLSSLWDRYSIPEFEFESVASSPSGLRPSPRWRCCWGFPYWILPIKLNDKHFSSSSAEGSWGGEESACFPTFHPLVAFLSTFSFFFFCSITGRITSFADHLLTSVWLLMEGNLHFGMDDFYFWWLWQDFLHMHVIYAPLTFLFIRVDLPVKKYLSSYRLLVFLSHLNIWIHQINVIIRIAWAKLTWPSKRKEANCHQIINYNWQLIFYHALCRRWCASRLLFCSIFW